MNGYYFAAGILCFLIGAVHSVFGEILIFKNLRSQGKFVVPKGLNGKIRLRHLRILWSSWHGLTIFGAGLGAILIKTAMKEQSLDPELVQFAIRTIQYTMLAGSFIVLGGTKGRHPGWVGLLLVAILLWMG